MTGGPANVWDHLASAAAARSAAGLTRSLRPRPADPTLIDAASNDYLSLARDPRLVEAAADATRRWGAGSTASRLVVGALELHGELESALAGFVGTEAGLLFSSGYLANLAVLPALTDSETLIVADRLNHASLIDGCRLSRASVAVYPHLDADAAARLLAERRHPRAILVTDAVFSVDGGLAPLARLHRIAREHGAALLVDEAHALGIVGPGGRGAAAAAGIAGEADVVVSATLSKSLGAQGGAVLGPVQVIDALVNTARTMIFDTGLAPAPTAAALAAIRILESEPELPAEVRRVAEQLCEVAAAAGWSPAPSRGAVVSLPVGDPDAAVAAQAVCAAHGVSVGCFRPPSVPAGESCLRLTARAGMTSDQLEVVGLALGAARADLAASDPRRPPTRTIRAADGPASDRDGALRVVTGTGTGVGKTIVTAALASLAAAAGLDVVVVKPVQTGVSPDDEGDLDVVRRLNEADLHCVELVRYPDPLSPEAAARVSGRPAPTVTELASRIVELRRSADLVLVEGAGGALVRFNDAGETFADLMGALARAGGPTPELVVVADPALGTLNHTALTLEALRRRGLPDADVVLGSWPAEDDLACQQNLIDLPELIGAPISGALPAGCASLSPAEFRAVAEAGLAPHFGGRFNGTIGTMTTAAESAAAPESTREPRMA